jgi:23S rRNA pseudouridine1911/1915/1917 synthase
VADQGSLFKQKVWTVSRDQAGLRLDALVRKVLPHLSRRQTETAIEEKLFLVNRELAKKGQRLAAGVTVSFVGPEQWLSDEPLPNPELRVPIVYEDSCLLVVDKPAGMDTHGFSGRDNRTLANFLASRRPEVLSVGKSRWEPGLIHRIDRETSGLVLIAKAQVTFDQLRLQFHRRQIKKTYCALVWGITETKGSVASPLAHDSRDPRRMQTITSFPTPKKQKHWKALTRFRRLNDSQGLSLLEIEIETGVTHQIRAHLASIGHPILGDLLYGADDAQTFGLRRHFLHAALLEFRHPASGRIVKIETDLPAELRETLNRLKMHF